VGALFAGNVKIGFRGKWLTWGYILGPLFVILFCVSRSYQISLGLITLVGASNAIRQTLSSSLLQIIAPQGYHGRVMSIFSILFGGMSRVGALGVGAMAEVTGAPWAMGVSAGASMMAGLILTIRLPDLYRIS
jgi:MFS-type transporter involved in bile tolerance (Atg22 family)